MVIIQNGAVFVSFLDKAKLRFLSEDVRFFPSFCCYSENGVRFIDFESFQHRSALSAIFAV